MPAKTPVTITPLSRKAIAAPKRSHAQVKKQARRNKFDKVRKLSQAMRDLDAINEKHKVGNLTFAACKYSKTQGSISYIEHSTAHGNMGAGIIMVRASVVNHSEKVYDLIEIAQAKAERDAKKKEAENIKAIEEMERLRQQEEGSQAQTDPNTDVAIDADTLAQHTELVQQLDEAITETSEQPPVIESKAEEQLVDELDGKLIENPDDDEAETDLPTEEEMNEPMTIATTKAQKRRQRMKKKVDRYMKDLAAREEKKGNNKMCRNYLADLRSKTGFKLTEDPDIQYFEVLVNSTSMVIEDAKMYTLTLSSEAKETILIIIGDLAMKSAVIRRIDPAYKVDKVFKEQTEFLDRIRAREDTQTFDMGAIDDLASDTDSMDGRDIEEFDIRELGLDDECPLLEPVTIGSIESTEPVSTSLLDPASL